MNVFAAWRQGVAPRVGPLERRSAAPGEKRRRRSLIFSADFRKKKRWKHKSESVLTCNISMRVFFSDPTFSQQVILKLEFVMDPKGSGSCRQSCRCCSRHTKSPICEGRFFRVPKLTQLRNPTATKSKNNLPPHSAHCQKTHWQGQNDGGQDEKHGKREGKRQ